MAWSLVSSRHQGLGGGGGTTTSIDTTGADLLIVIVQYYSGTPTPSDSKSNSWSLATSGDRGGLYYATNPTVGTGHTFTTSAEYSTIHALAYSGAALSSVLDQVQAVSSGTGSPYSAPSITPTQDGELLCAAINEYNSADSGMAVNSGFTLRSAINSSSGNYIGGAVADLFQGTASTVDPEWTWTGGNSANSAFVASFKAAAGGGATTSRARFLPTNWAA